MLSFMHRRKTLGRWLGLRILRIPFMASSVFSNFLFAAELSVLRHLIQPNPVTACAVCRVSGCAL